MDSIATNSGTITEPGFNLLSTMRAVVDQLAHKPNPANKPTAMNAFATGMFNAGVDTIREAYQRLGGDAGLRIDELLKLTVATPPGTDRTTIAAYTVTAALFHAGDNPSGQLKDVCIGSPSLTSFDTTAADAVCSEGRVRRGAFGKHRDSVRRLGMLSQHLLKHPFYDFDLDQDHKTGTTDGHGESQPPAATVTIRNHLQREYDGILQREHRTTDAGVEDGDLEAAATTDNNNTFSVVEYVSDCEYLPRKKRVTIAEPEYGPLLTDDSEVECYCEVMTSSLSLRSDWSTSAGTESDTLHRDDGSLNSAYSDEEQTTNEMLTEDEEEEESDVNSDSHCDHNTNGMHSEGDDSSSEIHYLQDDEHNTNGMINADGGETGDESPASFSDLSDSEEDELRSYFTDTTDTEDDENSSEYATDSEDDRSQPQYLTETVETEDEAERNLIDAELTSDEEIRYSQHDDYWESGGGGRYAQATPSAATLATPIVSTSTAGCKPNLKRKRDESQSPYFNQEGDIVYITGSRENRSMIVVPSGLMNSVQVTDSTGSVQRPPSPVDRSEPVFSLPTGYKWPSFTSSTFTRGNNSSSYETISQLPSECEQESDVQSSYVSVNYYLSVNLFQIISL